MAARRIRVTLLTLKLDVAPGAAALEQRKQARPVQTAFVFWVIHHGTHAVPCLLNVCLVRGITLLKGNQPEWVNAVSGIVQNEAVEVGFVCSLRGAARERIIIRPYFHPGRPSAAQQREPRFPNRVSVEPSARDWVVKCWRVPGQEQKRRRDDCHTLYASH